MVDVDKVESLSAIVVAAGDASLLLMMSSWRLLHALSILNFNSSPSLSALVKAL